MNAGINPYLIFFYHEINFFKALNKPFYLPLLALGIGGRRAEEPVQGQGSL